MNEEPGQPISGLRSGEAGAPSTADLARAIAKTDALEIPTGISLRGPNLASAIEDALRFVVDGKSPRRLTP